MEEATDATSQLITRGAPVIKTKLALYASVVALTALNAAHAQSPPPNALPVTVDNFIRAESDLYFGGLIKDSGGPGARFMGLVHHTDPVREWAYDRTSHVGKLDKALDEATARGWTVVDMKRDWRVIFPAPP